jgi:hypothetical protein
MRPDGEEPVGQPGGLKPAATAVGPTRPPVGLIPGTLDIRMLEAFSRAPHHRYLGTPEIEHSQPVKQEPLERPPHAPETLVRA